MSNGKLTIEEKRALRKKEARAEKSRIKRWYAAHPKWNDFTKNQKRNMRKRLKNRG